MYFLASCLFAPKIWIEDHKLVYINKYLFLLSLYRMPQNGSWELIWPFPHWQICSLFHWSFYTPLASWGLEILTHSLFYPFMNFTRAYLSYMLYSFMKSTVAWDDFPGCEVPGNHIPLWYTLSRMAWVEAGASGQGRSFWTLVQRSKARG